MKKSDNNIKYKVFKHYSNGEEPKCNKCGFSDIRALCLDHINSDGNIHRKYHGGKKGINLYRHLYKNNFESDFEFQVLCANCNLIKCFENKEFKHVKSEEWKAKMSDIQSKIIKKTGSESSNSKKVNQYDLEDNFIRTWDYIKEAESFYNSNPKAKNIVACCNNRQKTAYGFKWKHYKY